MTHTKIVRNGQGYSLVEVDEDTGDETVISNHTRWGTARRAQMLMGAEQDGAYNVDEGDE